ncbi:MAG: MBL fold metallo-hydrolase [Lachnospiraceae bacterium]|nr:MBL fold metallo-hydrolase [Ruminococcus sp.]MCM1275890.1 MBL fold metallo-hydrolase [Lachnospiraceae bacterium]
MYELKRVGGHTYYIAAPTNVGVYEYGGRCCLIDAGGDSGFADAALKIIAERGWELEKVFCTHSHADHTGGCHTLRERTGCEIYAPGVCAAVVRHSFLQPVTLFGGYPTREMRSKFVMARACECNELTEDALPEGLEFVHIDGHDFEQAAFGTADGVWFTADGAVDEGVIERYRISFLYDVGEHLKSLEKLKTLEGRLFIPSHSEPLNDMAGLADANIRSVYGVAETIKGFLKEPLTIDGLLEKLFAEFGIKLYLMQYELVGATTRSYLSWLKENGEVACIFEGSKLLWKST